MPQSSSAWITAADARRARLLHCSPLPPGEPRCELTDSIDNRWEEHQRGRPSPLKGKGGHSHADFGHEDEQRLDRFAHDVVQWLEKQLEQRGIDRVTLFAPPKLLGELRRVYPASLKGRIDDAEGDFASMDENQIARNATVHKRLRKTG